MHSSLRIISFLAAGLMVAACEHKTPDNDPKGSSTSSPTHVGEVGKASENPIKVEAQYLSSELTKMGTPVASWAPGAIQLFALRLDRLEWLNKQEEDIATTKAVDAWRNEYDSLLIGDPKTTVAKEADLSCGMFQSAGGSNFIPSNAAFRCLNHKTKFVSDTTPVKTIAAVTSDFKQAEGSTPEKCVNNPTRLCQALVMVQQFNRQCGALASMIAIAKDKNFVLGEALGCYLQITPVIDDSLALATAEDAEIVPYFQIELATVDRFRRILENFRAN